MKDWTSLLLQAKTNCGSESTAEEVLKQFLPFVEATASAVDCSVGSVLASALFTALSKRKSEIEDSVDLSKVQCVEQTASKSGALDAVSDDCLKKALTFVSDLDRIKSVERVCHRLFHASRNTAVFYAELSSVPICRWRTFRTGLRVAHWDAFPIHRLVGVSKPMLTGLKATIRCATISPLSVADIGTTHFPQLSEARFEEITVSQATAILSLNSGISRLSLTRMVGDSADDASQTQLLIAVSKLKNVRSLELEQNFGKYRIGDDCDFSHITQLTLGCNDCRSAVPFASLMHGKLKSLSLKTCCIPNTSSASFALSSLTSFELEYCGCESERFPSLLPFDIFCMPLLEKCVVDTDFTDFAHFVSKCTAKSLTVCVFPDDSTSVADREKWSKALAVASERGTLQSLTVSTCFHFEFLRWLARSSLQKTAAFTVELHAGDNTWNKINYLLGLDGNPGLWLAPLKAIRAQTLDNELLVESDSDYDSEFSI